MSHIFVFGCQSYCSAMLMADLTGRCHRDMTACAHPEHLSHDTPNVQTVHLCLFDIIIM